MPRKKKEPVNVATEERVTATEVAAAQQVEDAKYGTSLVDEHQSDLAILSALAKQVDIPDDKPAGISLRDRAVLHLLAGADLHRIAPDAVTHRIKRCIDIANQVVELLGEDA